MKYGFITLKIIIMNILKMIGFTLWKKLLQIKIFGFKIFMKDLL